MNKQLPQLKTELVQDIKELATALQTCETFSGVLSYENKLKSLYEKFVLLKFLEQKNLSPEVLPQFAETTELAAQIKESETKPTPVATSQVERELIAKEPSQNSTAEIEEEEEKPVFYDFKTHQVLREEEKTVVADFSQEDDEPEETPQNTPNNSPIYNIPPMVLDFNDRIGFLNQLFLGDDEFMESTLDILNRISDPNSTQMYLNDLEQEMHLDEDKREYFERLKELALKRFE